MKTTRRVLFAENALMRAQLAACNPESRKGLKAKLAATRAENESLKKANTTLLTRVAELQPASLPA